ncbi:SCUB1-like protein [Mya arenaria]|uniref:SCUB1-like protein n=1 Tax=Mya arenaria TaxID=6604 RepID=A0ABY7DDB5_MYAAR|nr:SCUB1-like protein [Mya arenaria]
MTVHCFHPPFSAICGPGKQFNNVSCDMCPIGTYKSVEGNAAMCEPCPSGFTTENQGATSRNDCSQRECEPGTYHVQNSVPITCTDCPIGTYSTASMVTQCTPCSTGKTTLATKSTSADACTTLCSNGRGLNLQTRGCDTCPVGQYNDASSGANPNFCKTCKSGTTNYQTGQSSCPATVDAVVYQYRKYEVMLKYKADIAGCHVDISGIQTQVSLAIRQTFISQRVARYNGQRSFCPSTTCNNIAVDFDKGTNCKLVTRRRKRALDYELDFLVSLSNISNVITDSVQKEEMMAKDIILLILNQNAAQLQPSTLAGIVQYDSIVTIASKEICTSGNELRGDVCNPCTLGHYGTDGETCKPCAADRYQDETGQADCKLCPANTYNDDFGATGPLACKGMKRVFTYREQNSVFPENDVQYLACAVNAHLELVQLLYDSPTVLQQWREMCRYRPENIHVQLLRKLWRTILQREENTNAITKKKDISQSLPPETCMQSDRFDGSHFNDLLMARPDFHSVCISLSEFVFIQQIKGNVQLSEKYYIIKYERDTPPTSNMPVILGAAIGGGGALLIIILVVVGCYKYLSVKDKREKKPDYRYGEFDQPMFVGTYDNVGFNGSMPRPIAPYPSIGYPSLGYKPQETSFDHGSITSPYRMRPGVNGDPIEEDDAQYIWTA